MKLYYAPGACSLSPHIVLREAGQPVELVQVDLSTGQIKDTGAAFRDISPKGYVPAIYIADGSLLTDLADLVARQVEARMERCPGCELRWYCA